MLPQPGSADPAATTPVTPVPAQPTSTPAEEIPRRVVVPPQPYDRLRMWLGIIVCIVVCLPPMVVNLGASDVAGTDEPAQLLTSRETWLRYHEGQKKAWMIPSKNGVQAVAEPPMPVWLHMLGWADLPATATPKHLAWRARMVSVLMAMLAMLATYWSGMSIGGTRTALLSALSLGTTLLLLYLGRMATSEPMLLAWVTIAIASGLWAMRPLRPVIWVSRRVSGWLFAGLALGAAILTKGPDALVFVLPPMIAAIIVTPQRRLGNSLGLLFAVFLGILVSAPWYLYVLEKVPDAWPRLRGAYEPPTDLFVISWSHTRLLAMLSPWVIFLMGALFQPFLRASRDYRRQLLIAWLWFVIIFVILSIPAARHPRFILPLLPAGALLVGQLFAFHIKLAQERQEDPGVNLLRVPHWLLLAIASVVGPLFIIYQPELMAAKWMESPELPNIGTLAAAGLGVALLLITLLGARWHFKWQPRMAFYATVAWMVTASSICFHSYAQSYHFRNLHKEDAPRVAAHASADRDIVILLRDKEPPLTDEFLYYLGRVVRRIEPTDLPAISQSPKLTLVVTVDQPDVEAMMKHAGFIEVMKFSDGVARKLYLSAAPAKPK